MLSRDSPERFVLLAIGLLVLIGPVVILALTLGLLMLFGHLALSGLTVVEFLELYIMELVLFAGLAYGVYRLTFWLVERRLPISLNELEFQSGKQTSDDETEAAEDRGSSPPDPATDE